MYIIINGAYYKINFVKIFLWKYIIRITSSNHFFLYLRILYLVVSLVELNYYQEFRN